jgi:RimJ/RimL family protein N-acetyltransferase
MKLRKVTYDDWKILLIWRNDPITMKHSFTQEPITEQVHKLWFNDSLINDRRSIYILEVDLIPIGFIRSDILEVNKYLLSWNIDPAYRGNGYGNKILEIFLKDKYGEFIAKIKPENIASIRMAEKNGFLKTDNITYIKKIIPYD